MNTDKFGNVIYQEQDLFDLVYKNYTSFDELTVEPSDSISRFEQFAELNLKKIDPQLYSIPTEEFDSAMQDDWFVPDDYKHFDVKRFCLERCLDGDASIRVMEELKAFEDKNMMMLLRTLKYLVDTLRKNNVVWGVGRGSSVASYVLFLLEVHRIDSIKYNLDWREFLR
jgi:DNA polymerase III alpha subunit